MESPWCRKADVRGRRRGDESWEEVLRTWESPVPPGVVGTPVHRRPQWGDEVFEVIPFVVQKKVKRRDYGS